PAAAPLTVTNPPLITVQQFLQGAASWGEQIRVRVRGTVTHSISDRTFFIQEGAFGVYVFHKPPRPFRVGDLVEVVGSPSLGGFKPTLQYCEARALGPGPLPIPRDVSIEQARSGEFHMCLVRVEGRLAEERLRGGGSLIISPGPREKAFTADLEGFEDLSPFALLE